MLFLEILGVFLLLIVVVIAAALVLDVAAVQDAVLGFEKHGASGFRGDIGGPLIAWIGPAWLIVEGCRVKPKFPT